MYLFKAETLYENCGIRIKLTFRQVHESTKKYTFMNFQLITSYPSQEMNRSRVYSMSQSILEVLQN